MAENSQNLFRRLTRLFRTGPTIKRRVKDYSGGKTASSALGIFKRSYNDVYNSTLSAYGAYDRMARYSDFSEMEATPEIASALDIYAEETVSSDDKGLVLHVHSENRKIQELLETLFYDTLNVEFNLVMWVRNLCKYGDFFLFTDVSPEFGVVNAYPIPITEMEREEGFDPEDPMAVRYRWITQGNQVLENWQVAHFRLLGNDAFLPYGSSVLESARRIWRQLILIEDAMLVYRVIRSPERRVFYIDVGNVPPENVAEYLESAKTSLKRNSIIDRDSGKVDLRYNPLSVDEDYFLPVRGGETGTKIDTLAGGSNTSAIEDVEYIQKKLFAALKIPKAYLGYDEDIGAKATLAQEDIRFSRTIQRIQKTILAELNKLAMVHLFSHGYEGEDLLDFSLDLNNPSSVAQQQKLELIRARFEIAGQAPEGIVDRRWIRKNIIGLTDKEIEEIEEGKKIDKLIDLELEATAAPGGGDEPAAGGDDDAGGGGLFAGDEIQGNLLANDDLPINMPESDGIPALALLDPDDDDDDEEDIKSLSIDDDHAPAKAQAQIRNAFNEPIKKSRKVRSGPEATHMPDFLSMTSTGRSSRKQDSLNQPYDHEFLRNPFGESKNAKNMDEYWEEKISQTTKMTREVESVLNNLGSRINIGKRSVLLENEEQISEATEHDTALDIEIFSENELNNGEDPQ
jgi:hypothetical protein